MVSIQKKMAAEFFGTFWLVFGGCGSAVLAGNYINNTGVAFAFGLTVLTMAFALGHISGCHLNPAVSLGLLTAGRFDRRELGPYILSQVLGAAAGSLAIYLIASGIDSFSLAASGFACNGYGEHSPGRYNFLACAVSEIVLTFFFLLVIIPSPGQTHEKAPGLAGRRKPYGKHNRIGAGHHRRDRQTGAERPGAGGNRPGAGAVPPDRHPGDQFIGQPGPQHRPGDFPRRLGNGAIVVFLGHAGHRRRTGRPGLPRIIRRETLKTRPFPSMPPAGSQRRWPETR